MERKGDMKLYSLKEIKDEFIGKVGTKERDAYEAELAEELHARNVGEAIRQARNRKNLTQEQLGQLMGVQKSQVSRIEKGKNLTFSTISRAFKAMGIPANFSFEGITLALW